MLRGKVRLRVNVSAHLHPLCFQHTRPEALARLPCVTRPPVWCVLLALPLFAADPKTDPKLDALLKNVESRYNRTQSLKLDFSETYAGISHAPSHTESGTLYLKKPGRMRWEYSFPAGKLFLSDGKDVLLYTPDEHRAQKSKLKQSEDMRAPLAFLLGKLDFAKEFKAFETRLDGQNTWIAAEPKNPNVEFSRVEFLAAPNGEILRLRVTGITNAKIDFAFSNEMLNAPVGADRFIFHPPPGVEVVEGDQQ
jgi:outer membrane lipoprotein carrier protein